MKVAKKAVESFNSMNRMGMQMMKNMMGKMGQANPIKGFENAPFGGKPDFGKLQAGVKAAGEPLIRREGLRSDIWVLMDFGCVIVHVFTDEARKFYNLERLWSDAEAVDPSSLPRP